MYCTVRRRFTARFAADGTILMDGHIFGATRLVRAQDSQRRNVNKLLKDLLSKVSTLN